jgi:hypothetical protein
MLYDRYLASIASAQAHALPALLAALSKDLLAGHLTDEQYEELAGRIAERQQAWLDEERAPLGQRPKRKPRAPLVTRPRRCAEQPRLSMPYRFVRRHGIMPILDVHLSSSAVRTLQYLICRTGKGHVLTTLTMRIAQDLGWCKRTIQKHLLMLQDHGYIIRSDPDPKTKMIRITLTERCEVAPARVQKRVAQHQALQRRTANGSAHTHTSRFRREERSGDSQKPSRIVQGANPSPAAGSALGEGSKPPAGSRREGRAVESHAPRSAPAAPDRIGVPGHSAEPRRILDRPRTALDDRLDWILRDVGIVPEEGEGQE